MAKQTHRRRPSSATRLVVLCGGALAAAMYLQSAHRRAGTAPQPSAVTPAKSPPRAIAGYPLGDASRWLPQVESFRLRATARFETTPDEIARRRRAITEQFPEVTDPDPAVFSELLAVQDVVVDCAFDRTRLRSSAIDRTVEGQDIRGDVRVWDGKRAVLHTQSFRSGQSHFRLAPGWDRVAEGVWGYVSYLNKQPPVFWWDNTPGARAEFEQTFGTPADFVPVGRETYHGVDCVVLMSTAGDPRDRYYVGVGDGRWYGAKEGIIAIPAGLARAYQRAVEEFFGGALGDNPSDAVWEEVEGKLGSLPPHLKVAWYRLKYARVVKDYIPVFEYWFSDFRDLGSGRVLPFREELLFFGHEGNEKTFVTTKRTLTVHDIRFDRSADALFQEPLTEGAMVSDDIHQPPLYYRHRANITPDEWERIVRAAREQQVQADSRARAARALIGRPAPPLPAGDWLNSAPLTWADLRGRVVVLKFWSVGCAPCYGELATLSEPAPAQSDAKGAPARVVFIGVHAPGARREDIEKVVNMRKLGAPIFIDREDTGESGQGEFFARCGVAAMPCSVAVDEEGRVLAHGPISEVLAAVAQHRARKAEKK